MRHADQDCFRIASQPQYRKDADELEENSVLPQASSTLLCNLREFCFRKSDTESPFRKNRLKLEVQDPSALAEALAVLAEKWPDTEASQPPRVAPLSITPEAGAAVPPGPPSPQRSPPRGPRRPRKRDDGGLCRSVSV